MSRSDLTDDELLAECRVDTFRAGGPGGQHQNKAESAVRLTHEPTGIVVTERSSRSQHRNRVRALETLRERIEELETPDKPRIPTKPTKGSEKRRLEKKRERAEKKRLRKPPKREDL